MQEAHARRPHRRIAGRACPKTWCYFNRLKPLTKSSKSTGPETTAVWRPVFLVRSATVGQQPTPQTHGTIGLFCVGRCRRDTSIGENWRRDRDSNSRYATRSGDQIGCQIWVIAPDLARTTANGTGPKPLKALGFVNLGEPPQTARPHLPRLGSRVRIPSPAPVETQLNQSVMG